MSQMLVSGVIGALVLLVQQPWYCHANSLGNGWGENIEWASSLKEGMAQSQDTSKPLMLIIHKPWCSACKSLKAKFANTDSIVALSTEFVMVNVQEDEELDNDPAYSPDGNYYPRILFYAPNGDLLKDVFNEHGDKEYKYYYHNTAHIGESMERVIGAKKEQLVLASQNDEL